MAPTPSPIFVHSPSHLSGKHIHRLRYQGLNFFYHPPRRPSPSSAEQLEARTLAPTLQLLSRVLEDPPPPPIAPTSSGLVVFAPEPSATPAESNQSVDLPGSIAAAVVVIVLILGGLLGLVIGGEMLRRQTRTRGKRLSYPPSRCPGRRRSEFIKNTTGSPQQCTPLACEKLPYDEKTLTPLTRPPPVLNRERQRRLSDVWPIRKLSMAVYNRRSCPQVERSLQYSLPMAKPQTTWPEFCPVLPYMPPPRTVLSCIPEELEECQGQTNGDIEAILGVTPLGSEPVVSMSRTSKPKLSQNGFDEQVSVAATERHGPQGYQTTYKAGTRDSDAASDVKSLDSSAPDMTPDRGESSRSSMTSLESVEDRESLREEVFELRRAQTRSMQMNKGVLLSLKTLNDSENPRSIHGECGPSPTSSALGAEGHKGCTVERELSLEMLCRNFSAVDLDEFPSPPSILPLIPSFVSGF